MNPPHFHLLLLPLTLLPPKVALGLWGIASFLCLFVSLRVIAREARLELTLRQRWLRSLGVLGFTGTSMVLVTGQLSFLLLLPITLAWAEARRGRWTQAGAYLGVCIGVKPFLLIFAPYLVLRRQFRAAITAAIGVLMGFLVGLLVFGLEAHAAWLRELSSIHWLSANTNASVLGFLARIFTENPHFSPLVLAPGLVRPLWLFVAGLIGVLTFAPTLFTTSTARTIDRDFALLLLAALLISPLGWTYYFWLPVGPLVAVTASWWLDREPAATSVLYLSRWRGGLVLAALPGLVWPFFATDLFQPSAWATVSLGSVYFWATFALWASLVVDWHIARSVN
jgi:alpha-1,2-mannosyltransferase